MVSEKWNIITGINFTCVSNSYNVNRIIISSDTFVIYFNCIFWFCQLVVWRAGLSISWSLDFFLSFIYLLSHLYMVDHARDKCWYYIEHDKPIPTVQIPEHGFSALTPRQQLTKQAYTPTTRKRIVDGAMIESASRLVHFTSLMLVANHQNHLIFLDLLL